MNLAGCARHRLLRDEEAVFGGPDVEEVEGAAAALGVGQGAAEHLTVQRDRLALEVLEDRIQPATEGVLERFGVQGFEDAAERVGARSTLRHRQERLEEARALLGEDLEGFPPVCAADRPEQRDREHVHDGMGAGSRDAPFVHSPR